MDHVNDANRWLIERAARIHELVKNAGGIERFRERVIAWHEDGLRLLKEQSEWEERREAHAQKIRAGQFGDESHENAEGEPPGIGWRYVFLKPGDIRTTIACRISDRAKLDVQYRLKDTCGWTPPELLAENRPPDFDSPLPLPDRELTLNEAYTVCAAIHDGFMRGVELINPWHTRPITNDVWVEVDHTLKVRSFEGLIEELQGMPESEAPMIDPIIHRVELDFRNRLSGADHSEDFTTVNWRGTQYRFTKGNQANVVRVLWNAWEKGNHSLTQESIGQKIESSAERFELAKVFRKRKRDGGYETHPAWGTMIRQDTKGSYKLAPPESA